MREEEKGDGYNEKLECLCAPRGPLAVKNQISSFKSLSTLVCGNQVNEILKRPGTMWLDLNLLTE